jgi:hypothetical protein
MNSLFSSSKPINNVATSLQRFLRNVDFRDYSAHGHQRRLRSGWVPAIARLQQMEHIRYQVSGSAVASGVLLSRLTLPP